MIQNNFCYKADNMIRYNQETIIIYVTHSVTITPQWSYTIHTTVDAVTQYGSHLFAFDLLLLLLHKLGGDSPDVVLGTTQVFPQLPQEHSGVLWVQEAGQVDLHLLRVGEL